MDKKVSYSTFCEKPSWSIFEKSVSGYRSWYPIINAWDPKASASNVKVAYSSALSQGEGHVLL